MAPKVYHVHPLVAGPLEAWPRHFARCRAMGFDFVASAPLFAPGPDGDIYLTADHESLHPALGWTGSADAGVARLADDCSRHEMGLILDVVVHRVAADSLLHAREHDWFEPDGPIADPPDPRVRPHPRNVAEARFNGSGGLGAWWASRLSRLARAGVAGFRCLDPQHVPPEVWGDIIATTRAAVPGTIFIAWTPGVGRTEVAALAGSGFDFVASSVAWWDARASWFVEEASVLRTVAPSIASPEPSFTERLATRLDPEIDPGMVYRRALRLAATTADGLFVPMGFEFGTRRRFDPVCADPRDFEQARQEALIDLSTDIRAATRLVDCISALSIDGGEMRDLTGPGSDTTGLLRADSQDVRDATAAIVLVINPDLTRTVKPGMPLDPLPPEAGAAFGRPRPLHGDLDFDSPLAPGEVRLIRYDRLSPIVQRPGAAPSVLEAVRAPRLVIEAVAPAVDGGAFPVKRLAGDTVVVSSDIFSDGHEVLAADLLWRAADDADWQREPMKPGENDRWEARFTLARVGRHLYTIEAWWDEWGTFRRDLGRKREAGQNLDLELAEGTALLREIAESAPSGTRVQLDAVRRQVESSAPAQRIKILLSETTRQAVANAGQRPFLMRFEPEIPVDADRAQAGFASWYEMFPRSATRDPARHGTFDDVIKDLPRIRSLGFDVLYFPPIHPIGHTKRKGRNNSLEANSGDVGSPYAIGNESGGHDAIHPCLGGFDDFRRLLKAARAHGLEVALDYAIQCSLDHPWIQQHPGWFRWRPDGSVRYAENPPKKYEDIVNVDFYAPPAIPDLWLALRDVVQFWVDEGVRIFRVDNPHTKPLPFWHWMIGDIRARNSDVIFLSEAFTRPKMMYRLAKIGFTQSYTYFTWRNSKQEISDYMRELTAAPVSDFFRPNFFVNTPDINPHFLQTSGRAGFLIRAVLATTLSGSWGMYSGFELCEGAPLPDREEYLDSEKYEIRVREWDAPGNIGLEIAALNRIRRANPALQTHLGLQFYNAFNDRILLYGKLGPGRRAMILIAVSLDPRNVQQATIEIPLWEWDLPDGASLLAEDLMREHRFVWNGKLQTVRLDPGDLPFAIWRVAPPGVT